MARILDKSFRYTPAVETDIARLFKRIDPQWNVPPARRRRKPGRVDSAMSRETGVIKIY
jgi:hypothetical protein